MKLKTLKDFELDDSIIEVDDALDQVREEAIKWVKESRNMIKAKLPAELNEYSFMKFHNITEEDLKSEDKRR